MADADCEIEYLDEDAEIVQQCFQTPRVPEVVVTKDTPLLVERAEKRRKRKKDDDSDYDPSEDYVPPSPPNPKNKKKRHGLKRSFKVEREMNVPNLKGIKKIIKENQLLSTEEQLAIRKKLNIRIPDYDDPLCLPVKALRQEENDLKRLNVWNNVCLEHFKHCDTMLRPERGETKSSVRSVVLRNVMNKQTRKVETTIWSKTSVENEDGDKKSEIFQCVLPKYKEKKVLNAVMMSSRKTKAFHVIDEVILTKEEHKDGEALVAYKPREAISSVYMMFDNGKSTDSMDGTEQNQDKDEESKMYMKELACCKVCAHCFQTSWRGAKKVNKKTIVCPVCARTYVTVHNLLAHFKTHTESEVQRYKHIMSAALAEIVDYHYTCRICQEKQTSIKN
ncbi:uncharacterized protein LOC115444617 [Manduca sexta]|uniref:uncharacterized protein LOC115444617 n=1 Tax=Manduca sexta TaxID=7130 RepID=UPI00188F30C2|nr:uncharacterized protein LOC115444617 [Manduca sexta]